MGKSKSKGGKHIDCAVAEVDSERQVDNLIMECVSINLEKLRFAAGLRQNKVAQGIGLTPKGYGDIEKGKTRFHVTSLFKLVGFYRQVFNKLEMGGDELRYNDILPPEGWTVEDLEKYIDDWKREKRRIVGID